jgi:hypothetical protein
MAALRLGDDLQEYGRCDVDAGRLFHHLDLGALGDQLAQIIKIDVTALRRVVESAVNVLSESVSARSSWVPPWAAGQTSGQHLVVGYFQLPL